MISVLPFQLAARQLAIPLEYIVRVIPMLLPTPLPGAPKSVAGVVSVHGQLLPVVDLSKALGFAELEVQAWTPMLWLKTSQRELLLPVEALHEMITVEPESFVEGSSAIINSALLNGVLARADDLIIIMDIEQLLSASDEKQLQQALAEFGPMTSESSS